VPVPVAEPAGAAPDGATGSGDATQDGSPPGGSAPASRNPWLALLGSTADAGGTSGPGGPSGPGAPNGPGAPTDPGAPTVTGDPNGPDVPSDGPLGSGSSFGGHPTWGPLASALGALGLSGPTFGGMTIGPTLVTATGAVTMAMAFGMFGKRRRAGDPPASDDELAAAAALGVSPFPQPLPGFDEAEDPEAQIPRWRRASLMEARKANPVRDATPAPRLTFDRGLVGPLDGRETRVIRFRVVRMLDTPDELRGAETGYLDRGDEVQLLEKYGAYWLVLCPDGRQGWVHNMTFGGVVEDSATGDRPVATMPIAAETWTMGEADQDTSVLQTYIDSRRREL